MGHEDGNWFLYWVEMREDFESLAKTKPDWEELKKMHLKLTGHCVVGAKSFWGLFKSARVTNFLMPNDTRLLLADWQSNAYLRSGDNGIDFRSYLRNDARSLMMLRIIDGQIFVNDTGEQITDEFDSTRTIIGFTSHQDSVYYKMVFSHIEHSE